LPEEILRDKTKKWRQINAKRYIERRKNGYVETQKEMLPPEVLR
jgi:pre-mRNA-processing factor 8